MIHEVGHIKGRIGDFKRVTPQKEKFKSTTSKTSESGKFSFIFFISTF